MSWFPPFLTNLHPADLSSEINSLYFICLIKNINELVVIFNHLKGNTFVTPVQIIQ